MAETKRHYVIGTAGHIDHGKTAMVKRLTGKDTDWLKEEKERGMTIDLGFAFLGDDVTIIDVPGHEKFVRNMVAGVSTIDLVLFVIAADDGIMPQTREHLDILKLLQIKQGIIVITKIDLVEPDWLELVMDDVRNLVQGTFLEDAPLMPVSNETGAGIDELKNRIMEMLAKTEERQDKSIFFLPIDRIFTMKGFGTVVAGTVLSGSLSLNQTVELLPQKVKLRVRGLQIHARNVDKVKIGDRAAINLVGIEKEAIQRGDVLAEPDFFQPTRFFDGKIYLLESAPRNLKHNDRIRLNIGTSEVIGRVSILDKEEIKPGEAGYVQFRMEKPIVTDVGNRFVIRSYSPVVTIGGGSVLKVNPRRHKRFSSYVLNEIKIFESGDNEKIVEHHLLSNKYKFVTVPQIAKELTFNEKIVAEIIRELTRKKKCFRHVEKGQDFFLHQDYYEKLKEKLLQALDEFHRKNPLKRGVSKTDLKVMVNLPIDVFLFNVCLDDLIKNKLIVVSDGRVALATHKIKISDEQRHLLDKISHIYEEEGFTTSASKTIAEKVGITPGKAVEIINILLERGDLVKVDNDIVFHRRKVDEAIEKIKNHFKTHEALTVGDFRQMLNTSRKYALPLLNYFDALGLTVRQQDVRVFNPDFI